MTGYLFVIVVFAFAIAMRVAEYGHERSMRPVQRQFTGAAYLLVLVCAVLCATGVIPDFGLASAVVTGAWGVYGVSRYGRDLLVPWGSRPEDRKPSSDD